MNEKPEDIYVLNKRVRLLQAADGFRTSMDAVMLAAACPAKEGQSILDLGCGVGSAGLCVLFRVPGTTLTGIDIQADDIELARENAKLNAFTDRAVFKCADIRDYREERFDHVISNPPYMEPGTHLASPSAKKAQARGQNETTLQDWLDAAFHTLKPRGWLSFVHRADRVDKIITGLGKRFGNIGIIPLWPKQGVEAKRVIVRAQKDRRSPARILPGIALHDENGNYTPQAEKILREGMPIL